MTWSEVFKHLTPDEMEEAEKDMDWILTAMEHPTYLTGKDDHSNMFILHNSNMYYVEYIKMCFEEKGYIVRIVDRKYISLIPERDVKPTSNKQLSEPDDER